MKMIPTWPSDVESAVSARVIFAASRAAALTADVPRPTIAIVADKSTFNNFGRTFWAELHILTGQPSQDSVPVMLMFKKQARTREYLTNILQQEDRLWIDSTEISEPFVTVMNEEDGYATLVHALGFAVAVATLRTMGDAVVLDIDNDDPRAALIASLDFHEGALRNSETYYAFRHGARHLTPYDSVAQSDARGTFRFVAQLPGVATPSEAIFDFTPDVLLRERLAVLIGRNGVGKSQLVQALVEGLRRHPESQGYSSTKAAVIEATPPFSRLIVLSSVASDTYPRNIPAWSGLEYEYVSLIQQAEDQTKRLLSTLVDCFRDPGEFSFVFEGKQLNRFDLLKTLLDRFGFWEDLAIPLLDTPPLTSDMFPMAVVVGGQRYVRLTQLSGEQRSVRIAALAAPHQPVGVLTQDGVVRRLSSGETAMLRFAVLAVATIERGSVLVLEEPETYLHPNYISQLMAILHDLLQATSSIALVVTHSAYVVREATRQRVNVLRRDEDGCPRFVVTPIQTFGASIDSISQFVFGDGLVSPQFRKTLEEWVAASPELSIEQVKEQYATELTPETMSFVAGLLHDRASQREI